MLNQELANEIVAYLNSAFPDKTQFDDLIRGLPQFSSIPEEDWLRVLDALQQDGRIRFKGIRTGIDNTLRMAANIVIAPAERRRIMQSPAPSAPVSLTSAPPDSDRSRRVWVVHGRNETLNTAMFMLLLSLGLKPVSFSKARELTGKPTPHISEILDSAFRHAGLLVDARALVVARAGAPTHEDKHSWEGKVAAVGPTSAMICCAESTPRPGTSANR
jgi:hypothetical protein